MTNTRARPALRGPEFIALAAFMMSVFALSVDVMIPALALIGNDLGLNSANETQYIVTALVLGMAIGQLFYGPLSDSVGRKPAIYAGLAVFIAGSIVCLVATDFPTMLAGRFLQGLGAAGPRIVTMALVRDQFVGPAMARVMSIIITVFITGPILAPFIGQGILLIAPWRFIFVLLLLLGVAVLAWFSLRQPETLAKEARRPFALRPITAAMLETFTTRVAIGHTIASGFAFGAIFGYINSARQIFQDIYAVGDYFPFYFSGLALAVGIATIANSRLVATIDMRTLCRLSALAQAVMSVAFFAISYADGGVPPLWSMMLYLSAMFFCLGILFGNLNAMAMQPLGHIAGVGASVVGSIGLFIAATLGTVIGQSFDGTLLPLVGGFAALSLLTIAALRWASAKPGN
ncbi:MAG: multidrug effflux MFS transporter [Rhodospirillaceae bacterium]|nr:multidrug effflux MFS transporter [Rhodospirillaceae bacterium]MBT3927634.1 multidrug effflux MFS transporter [Rhodospirillaceae bacterium]MBT5037389.1 multidrug effflux MFS transporter [Rhodospirillaceae bacterium]MBT6829742.1 multidrug effflux MFS transporter [Rhodospirillaceae bacterium]MBT7293071.1 multidrug effflux MFS transporter [Rhodospirillaceae bacterium]